MVTCWLLCPLMLFAPSVFGEVTELSLRKCCGEYQMLDNSLKRCMNASWPRSPAVQVRLDHWGEQDNSCSDPQWLQRWIPNGIPFHDPSLVDFKVNQLRSDFDFTLPVNSSSVWRDQRVNESYWPGRMVVDKSFIVRPRQGGGRRRAEYCVDATPFSHDPYALLFSTRCDGKELCIHKCCPKDELVTTNRKGQLICALDNASRWSLRNSRLALVYDEETPYEEYRTFFSLSEQVAAEPVRAGDATLAKLILYKYKESVFWDISYPCVDFQRPKDGRVREVVLYHIEWRIGRGLYKVSHHFSFISAFLLVAALASVACSPRTRSTPHGKALVCHAVCLLLFNVGQLILYLGFSGIHKPPIQEGNENIPDVSPKFCKIIGYIMYFIMMGAAFWLTAICGNMAAGFRRIRVVVGSTNKRFLVLSTFAWGMTVLLTSLNVWLHEDTSSETWFRSSFMETRTCYSYAEQFIKIGAEHTYGTKVWGTLLFYYVPMLCLNAANVTSLALTARQVHFLRRGNSLLKKEEGAEAGGGRLKEGKKRAASDPRSATVYLKLLLSTGVLEVIVELVPWFLTWDRATEGFAILKKDDRFLYLTAAYCADLLRACIVMWLCAPEEGTLRALWYRMSYWKDDGETTGATGRTASGSSRHRGPAMKTTSTHQESAF